MGSLGDVAAIYVGTDPGLSEALVARRQEDQAYRAEVDPPNWQRAAGLTTCYNRHKFHAALITHEPGLGRCLRILSCAGDVTEALTFSDPVALPGGPVTLSVVVAGAVQQFYWETGGVVRPLGGPLDALVISDESGRGEHASFTGAFVGMVACDLTGQGGAPISPALPICRIPEDRWLHHGLA